MRERVRERLRAVIPEAVQEWIVAITDTQAIYLWILVSVLCIVAIAIQGWF